MIGFPITVMLAIYELSNRINFESRIIVMCLTGFIGLFLSLSKLEMFYHWQFHRSIAHVIKLLALMTYTIYLLHLTAGSALISILMSKNLSRGLAMGITVIFVLSLSLWIVKVIEPLIRVRLTS